MTSTWLRVGLSAIVVAICHAAAPARAADRTLTISVYAFAQDAYKQIVYDPFEAKCGCKVVVETGNSAERLAKLEANKASPVIDMAVVSAADALQAARGGLVDAVDTTKLHNFDQLYDIAKDPNGDGMSVGYTFYSTSIAYRSDKIQINSWADLVSDKLAGHVAVPNISTNQGPPALFMLGLALGATAPDLKEPIHVIGEHKDGIVTFYVRSSQLIQLMAQDEIWAAPIGRFSWSEFAKLHMPIKWATPKEGETGGMNVMIVTKGSNNRDLALQFMDFWLSTEVQTKLAEKLVDSPANKNVKVAPEIADNLTYGDETAKNLKLISSDVVLQYRDAWLKEWNDMVGQ